MLGLAGLSFLTDPLLYNGLVRPHTCTSLTKQRCRQTIEGKNFKLYREIMQVADSGEITVDGRFFRSDRENRRGPPPAKGLIVDGPP